MRKMLDENIATTILPLALVKISSNPSVTSSSDPVNPLRSTLVLSDSSASTPAAPSSAKRWKSKCCAVERRLVDLEVPGVDHHPVRRRDRERDAVRDAVRHPQELDREAADGDPVPRLDHAQPLLRRGDGRLRRRLGRRGVLDLLEL